DDLAAEVHRVADGLLLVVEVRERDRRVAMTERDGVGVLDLLEGAFLGARRARDEQAAKGDKADEGHASESDHSFSSTTGCHSPIQAKGRGSRSQSARVQGPNIDQLAF